MYYEKLKELREKKNLTKRDVAKQFNVSESTYGKWELGKRKPDLETIAAIAEFYAVSTDFLLGNTDDPHPPGEKAEATDEDIKFALWGTTEVSDKQLEILKKIAKSLED